MEEIIEDGSEDDLGFEDEIEINDAGDDGKVTRLCYTDANTFEKGTNTITHACL